MNRKKLRASHHDHNGDLWTITWEGGAYAELVNPSGEPVEVLNFWDYDVNAPQNDAPKDTKELRSRLCEWLNESADWLHHY